MIGREACNCCGALCDENQFNREGLGYCGECFADPLAANAARIRKADEFRPQGCALKPTAIDEAKAAADFRVIQIDRRGAVIDWCDGRREKVTTRRLEALQKSHTWAPDF